MIVHGRTASRPLPDLARTNRALLIAVAAKMTIGLCVLFASPLLQGLPLAVATTLSLLLSFADIAAFFTVAYFLFQVAVELRIPPLVALVAVVVGGLIPWLFFAFVLAAAGRSAWRLRRLGYTWRELGRRTA